MAIFITISQDNDGISRTHVANGPQWGLPRGFRQRLACEAEETFYLASSSSSSSKLEEEERVDLLALALLEDYF